MTVTGSVNYSLLLKATTDYFSLPDMKFLLFSFAHEFFPPAWQGSLMMHGKSHNARGRVYPTAKAI